MDKKVSSKERIFSIELASKKHLRNVALTNGFSDMVLVEGTIGELLQATFKEGVILEVKGRNGTLRVDLGENEITRLTLSQHVEVKNQ